MSNRADNQRQRGSGAARRAGFTVVEMLVVVAIVILLLSILIVALNAASRSSQMANTSARMAAMSRALVSFRNDIGYLPPVLNRDRGLLNLPAHDPNAPSYATVIQDYYSVTSMAEYLTGYGSRNQDGYGVAVGSESANAAENPPFGIRHPGSDGVWGASKDDGLPPPAGALARRKPDTSGNVFGPYLELDDPNLLASIDGSVNPNTGMLNIFFPGEAGYDEANPKVIVDYWGRPIEYYRLPYPIGGIRTGFAAVDRDGDGDIDRKPSLSDIFVLRKFNIPPGEDVSGIPDRANDTATTAALNAAEFALFSYGPDRTANRKVRYDDPSVGGIDTDFANRDNIVELGR